MKIKYFEETDTLFIQIGTKKVIETKDLNDNVVVDVDENGNVVSITIEHAKAREGNLDFSYELIAA